MITKIPKIFLYLFFLSLFFIVLDKLGQLNFARRAFSRFFDQKRNETIDFLISDSEDPLASKRTIAELQLRLSQLEEENRASKRLLGADIPAEIKFLPAALLGVSNFEFQIDIGRDQGVEAGDWVIADNVLVGKITDSDCCASKGDFLNKRGAMVAVGIWRQNAPVSFEQDPAFIKKEGRLVGKGLLVGNIDQLVIEEILPEEEVEAGDLVSSLEKGNFLIGVIKEVGLTEDKVFQKASVSWLINPRKLATVFLVLD